MNKRAHETLIMSLFKNDFVDHQTYNLLPRKILGDSWYGIGTTLTW